MLRLVLCGSLAALVACDGGGAGGCDDLADVEASLEIGSGQLAFEPLGEVTGFERGPQGGYHVYGSLRAPGVWTGNEDAFDETRPVVSFTLVDDAGGFTGGYLNLVRPMTNNDEGVAELVGDLIILDITEPADAEDAAVTLAAEVQDACGTTVTAEATTRISEGAF